MKRYFKECGYFLSGVAIAVFPIGLFILLAPWPQLFMPRAPETKGVTGVLDSPALLDHKAPVDDMPTSTRSESGWVADYKDAGHGHILIRLRSFADPDQLHKIVLPDETLSRVTFNGEKATSAQLVQWLTKAKAEELNVWGTLHPDWKRYGASRVAEFNTQQ